MRIVIMLVAILTVGQPISASDRNKRQVLFVCHSISFIHPAVVDAEQALRELGSQNGFELTCFRYTHDPDELATESTRIYGRKTQPGKPLLAQYREAFRAVTGKSIEADHLGRLDKRTLSRFDAVVFYTKDDPCGTAEERRALLKFVREGRGFVGFHSASVTHYDWPEYGRMLGGYFERILLNDLVPMRVEDSSHPATRHFSARVELPHELYQFKAPYDRNDVHVLLSVDPHFGDSLIERVREGRRKAAELGKTGDKDAATKVLRSLPQWTRKDGDFAVSWTRKHGRGRVFYTALGHHPEQWRDPRFRLHALGGLMWAMEE